MCRVRTGERRPSYISSLDQSVGSARDSIPPTLRDRTAPRLHSGDPVLEWPQRSGSGSVSDRAVPSRLHERPSRHRPTCNRKYCAKPSRIGPRIHDGFLKISELATLPTRNTPSPRAAVALRALRATPLSTRRLRSGAGARRAKHGVVSLASTARGLGQSRSREELAFDAPESKSGRDRLRLHSLSHDIESCRKTGRSKPLPARSWSRRAGVAPDGASRMLFRFRNPTRFTFSLRIDKQMPPLGRKPRGGG